MRWATDWPTEMGRKDGGPRSTSLPSGILIHAAVWPQYTGQNWWMLCSPFVGERGPYLTQCGHTKWHLDHIHPAVWHNRHGSKIGGGLCPQFFEGGAGSPSNTKSTGQRHTSIPSGILIRPAVWPQRTLAKNWGLCLLGVEVCP